MANRNPMINWFQQQAQPNPMLHGMNFGGRSPGGGGNWQQRAFPSLDPTAVPNLIPGLVHPGPNIRPQGIPGIPEITPDTLKQHDKDNQGNNPLGGTDYQGLPQGDGTTPGGGNWWDGIGFWGNPNFGPASDPKQPLMNPDNFPTQGSGPFWGVDKQWLW